MKKLFALLYVGAVYALNPTIPVVDLKDFHNLEKRSEFLDTLSYAVKEIGFFAVVNTDIDVPTIDKAYDDITHFFKLDEKTKLAYDGRPYGGERGYAPVYREIALGGAAHNFMEFFHIGRESTSPLVTPNIWPKEVDIKSTAKLFDELERCTAPLLDAFAQIIQIPHESMREMMVDGQTLLRMIHYPPSSKKSNKESFWAAAHVDCSLFTVLPKATAKGLELQLKDGSWIPVIVPENAFIVNIGEKFVNLTNGLFRSAMHRVRAPSDEPHLERYSMVQFNHPRGDADLSPLVTCIEMTGGKQLFPKATSWEILLEFLVINEMASDEMIKEYAECGMSERRLALGAARIDALKQLKKHGVASKEVLAYLDVHL